jgi:hypothetical protein
LYIPEFACDSSDDKASEEAITIPESEHEEHDMRDDHDQQQYEEDATHAEHDEHQEEEVPPWRRGPPRGSPGTRAGPHHAPGRSGTEALAGSHRRH